MWAQPRLPRVRLTYGRSSSSGSDPAALSRKRDCLGRPILELQERPHRPVQPSHGAGVAKLGEDLRSLIGHRLGRREVLFHCSDERQVVHRFGDLTPITHGRRELELLRVQLRPYRVAVPVVEPSCGIEGPGVARSWAGPRPDPEDLRARGQALLDVSGELPEAPLSGEVANRSRHPRASIAHRTAARRLSWSALNRANQPAIATWDMRGRRLRKCQVGECMPAPMASTSPAWASRSVAKNRMVSRSPNRGPSGPIDVWTRLSSTRLDRPSRMSIPISADEPHTASASSGRQPPAKTASRANSRLDGSRRKSWLQAIVDAHGPLSLWEIARRRSGRSNWRPIRSAIAAGASNPTRPAANSIPSGRPSRRVQIPLTAATFSVVRRNPSWTRRARSTKSWTQSEPPAEARSSAASGRGRGKTRILLLGGHEERGPAGGDDPDARRLSEQVLQEWGDGSDLFDVIEDQQEGLIRQVRRQTFAGGCRVGDEPDGRRDRGGTRSTP